jgi:hypothetical protein
VYSFMVVHPVCLLFEAHTRTIPKTVPVAGHGGINSHEY